MKKIICLVFTLIFSLSFAGMARAVDMEPQTDDIGVYYELDGVKYYFDDENATFYYIDSQTSEKVPVNIADYLPDFTIADDGETEYQPEEEPYQEEEEQPADGSDLINGTAEYTRSYKVRVLEVLGEDGQQLDFLSTRNQQLRVLVLQGPYKGTEQIAVFDISDTLGNGQGSMPAKKGDYLLAYFYTDETGTHGVVTSFYRAKTLLILAAVFFIMFAVLGGLRGLRSVVALLMTCLGCIFIMIPAIIKGMSPVAAAVLLSIFAISVTLIIVYGFTIKTLAASMGALGGVILSGILVAIANVTMKMTGIVDNEAMSLGLMSGDLPLDLRGVLFATIIISVLGGTIDVSISIASALDELAQKAKGITGAELMASGVNVGIDVIGASLNTLILSYVGGSLHLLLLVVYYVNTNDIQPALLINDEQVASELLRAVAGSIGLLATGPITSLVASLLFCRGNFGRLTADCFGSVAAIKRATKKMSQKADERSARLAEERQIIKRHNVEKTQARERSYVSGAEKYNDLYSSVKSREVTDHYEEETDETYDFEDDFDDM